MPEISEPLMSSQNSRILIVDDDRSVSEGIAMTLRSKGHSVCIAESGWEAIRRLKDTPLKLVISDLHMPGMSGFELIAAVRWRFPDMPIIAMSGTYSSNEVPRTVNRFYAKGKNSPDALLTIVEELLSCSQKKPPRSIRSKGLWGRAPAA